MIGSYLLRPLNPDTEELIAQTAVNLLNCDLSRLPVNMLQHSFMADWHEYGKSVHLQPYRNCMKYPRLENQTKLVFRERKALHQQAVFTSCKQLLQQSCDQSRVRGFKTIRMTIGQIARVLQIDPEVKVIYSARDPRGIANSRYTISSVDKRIARTLKDTIREICVRMRYDTDALGRLSRDITNRVYHTHFEDILTDPERHVREMYGFMGMNMTKEIRRWVTKQGKKAEKERHNHVMQKWRSRDENGRWWDVGECEGLIPTPD